MLFASLSTRRSQDIHLHGDFLLNSLSVRFGSFEQASDSWYRVKCAQRREKMYDCLFVSSILSPPKPVPLTERACEISLYRVVSMRSFNCA